MLRQVIFQAHWLLGISLGLVLAIMGVTGALLSFEEEIVDALGPSRVSIPISATALGPDELVQHILRQRPNAVVGQIRLSSNPARAVGVRLQNRSDRDHGHGRGVTYVDPYSGEILGEAAAGGFFSFVEKLHRFMALPAGEDSKGSALGRQITGAAALALIFFALSGLYLRWPRRPLNWRSWLKLDLHKTGRNLYRELHVVIGTGVLVFYLLAALTGLTWSYDWYRQGMTAVLGGESRDYKDEVDRQKGIQVDDPVDERPEPAADRASMAQTPRVSLRLASLGGGPDGDQADGHDAGKGARPGWDGQIGGHGPNDRKPADEDTVSGIGTSPSASSIDRPVHITAPIGMNGPADPAPGTMPVVPNGFRLVVPPVTASPLPHSNEAAVGMIPERNGGRADTRIDVQGATARRPHGENGHDMREEAPSLPAVSLDIIWADFLWRAGPDFGEAAISMPRGGGPVRVDRPLQSGFHDGIMDRYFFDSRTGTLLRTDLASDRPMGRTITGAILAFHTGAFLGMPGRVLMMIASLLMPLFFVTGLLLYLHRRRMKRDAREAGAMAANTLVGPDIASDLLIVHASQTGRARHFATLTAAGFAAGSQAVRLLAIASLKVEDLRSARIVLFVVSTYGEGEPPDGARAFAKRVMNRSTNLEGLRYAVLALGDHEYVHFCRFGRDVDIWLRGSGARRLFDRIEIDGEDREGQRQWTDQIAVLGARIIDKAWDGDPFDRWILTHRRLLNAGSPGGPVYHLRLVPKSGPIPPWRAGDIAEIRPCNDPMIVTRYLSARRLDGDVDVDGRSLREHLAEVDLATDLSCTTPKAEINPARRRLSTREYSIASIPADGSLDLVVRQVGSSDGLGLGMGSGWLTEYLPFGGETALRIRTNVNFHRPRSGEMILIGNGTGIAGLRGLLREAAQARSPGHWLLFGERSVAHDHFFQREVSEWLANGTLRRFEAAWSRDEHRNGYVQDLLLASAADVRSWIRRGASVMVCGSLQGMAQGVDAALREILGEAMVDQLTERQRYRTDVY
jgi:sulfite reductase (NADPH) flavoprotein alpha-component